MVPLTQTSIWLIGVAGCAFAATVLWRRRTVLTWSVFAGSCVFATTGAVLLTQSFVHPPWDRIYPGQPMAEYELVCVERSIPVCVHPAFEARLETYADRIDALIEPLIGVPGGPTRAEQLPSPTTPRVKGTIEILPSPIVVGHAAYELVHEEGTDLTAAQRVVAIWLLERAGASAAEARMFGSGQPDASVAEAVRRFSALSPDAQRAWLMANFQDLRAGRISVEDMP